MAVVLRMTRMGKKGQPFYRVVAVDSRKARDGKYIELLGTFEPVKGESKIDEEIAMKWLKLGAKPSDSVRELLSKDGIMKKFHESKKK